MKNILKKASAVLLAFVLFLSGDMVSFAANSFTLSIPGVSAGQEQKVDTVFVTYRNGKTAYTMVPQGICFAGPYVVFSGYDYPESDNAPPRPSVLWIKNARTDRLVATVELPEAVHAGGVCYDGRYLWVSSAIGMVRWILFSDIERQIENGYTRISFTTADDDRRRRPVSITVESGVLETGTNKEVDTVTYYDGFLYTAEFAKNTQEKPKLTKLSVVERNGKPSELAKETEYDLPIKVQGIQFYESNNEAYVILSRSYGRAKGSLSCIDSYKLSNLKEPVKTKDLSANNTYLMVEGIAISGDYIYAISESAAWYYKKGSLLLGKSPNPRSDVYAMVLSDLL